MAFSFKEITSVSMGLGTTDIRRGVLPEMANVTQDVPGYAGTVFMRNDIRPRLIEIDVNFTGSSVADAMTDTHTLAQWLYSTTPELLTFDDEPDLLYYAVLDGSTDLEAIGAFRRGTLRFICTDPFAYADTDDSTNITEGANSISNAGGMYAFPVIEATIDADSTFVSVSSEETGEYVHVGDVTGVSGTPATPDTPTGVAMHEAFNDISGWASSTLKPLYNMTFKTPTVNMDDHADNPMVMGQTGSSISPDYGDGDIGTGAGWHGPTITKSLPAGPLAPATNFIVTTLFQLGSYPTNLNELGSITILLINGDGNVFAHIGMADAWDTGTQLMATAFVGTQQVAHGVHPQGMYLWNNCYFPQNSGKMQVMRNVDTWQFFFQAQNTYAWTMTLPDIGTDDLAAIGVNMMGYAAYDTPTIVEGLATATFEVSDIVVENLGDTVFSGGYYFLDGDTIKFDHRQGVVMLKRSGESDYTPYSRVPSDLGGNIPMNALVDLGSSFFYLPTGSSTVNVLADTGVGITGTVTLTKRWL